MRLASFLDKVMFVGILDVVLSHSRPRFGYDVRTKRNMALSVMGGGLGLPRPPLSYPIKSQVKILKGNLMLIKKIDPRTGVWVQSVMSRKNPAAAFKHMTKKLKKVVGMRQRNNLIANIQGNRRDYLDDEDDFRNGYLKRNRPLNRMISRRKKMLPSPYSKPLLPPYNNPRKQNSKHMLRSGGYSTNRKSPKFSLGASNMFSNALRMPRKRYKNYNSKRRNYKSDPVQRSGNTLVTPTIGGQQMNPFNPSLTDVVDGFEERFDNRNFDSNLEDRVSFLDKEDEIKSRYFGGSFGDVRNDDRMEIFPNLDDRRANFIPSRFENGLLGRTLGGGINPQKGMINPNQQQKYILDKHNPDYINTEMNKKSFDDRVTSKGFPGSRSFRPISSDVGLQGTTSQLKGTPWKTDSSRIARPSSVLNNFATTDNLSKKDIYRVSEPSGKTDKYLLENPKIETEVNSNGGTGKMRKTTDNVLNKITNKKAVYPKQANHVSTIGDTKIKPEYDKALAGGVRGTNENMFGMIKKGSQSMVATGNMEKIRPTQSQEQASIQSQVSSDHIQVLPINPFSAEQVFDVEMDSTLDMDQDMDQATFALLGIGPHTVGLDSVNEDILGDERTVPDHPPPIHVPVNQKTWLNQNMFPDPVSINQNNALPPFLPGNEDGRRVHMSGRPLTRSELIGNTIKGDFDRLDHLEFGLDGFDGFDENMDNVDVFGKR